MKNKGNLPSVSVIVPCFNVINYVDRALESLRRQTFQDFEIVAIDDGSADQTHERLRQWTRSEPRLRIFRQENKGLYLARLAGIAQATGEWVTF
ncbi:MAG: glycosyltransferase, partial [Clostridia bacterium]|nr:glycosyltransferase [Clostridia bacterium]